MTLLLTIVAVPINTVVGITAAINITRNEFPGKTLLIAMLDLPFSISPVVTGKIFALLKTIAQAKHKRGLFSIIACSLHSRLVACTATP